MTDAEAVGGWTERSRPEFGVKQRQVGENQIEIAYPSIHAMDAFAALCAVFDLVTDDGDDVLSHKTVRCREVVRTMRAAMRSTIVNPPDCGPSQPPAT